MMGAMLPLAPLLALLVVRESLQLPNGAPENACSSMAPQHGYGGQPNSASPYTIDVSNDSYSAGGSLTVTISGTQSFQGFLIMARELSSSQAIGTFEESVQAKRACSSRGAWGLTHINETLKTNLSLTWRAPASFNGPLRFYTTVVKAVPEFWVQLESPLIWDGNSSRLPINTTPNSRNIPVDVSKSGCGTIKSCLSYPAECTGEDCTYLVTWNVLPPSATAELAIRFHMQAKKVDADPGYVSVGFARGIGMDGISIVNCIGGGVIKQTYATTTAEPQSIEAEKNIRNTTTSVVSDFIRCSFVWINDAAARTSPQQFNLTSRYYVVMARGKAAGSSGIYKHSGAPLRLDEQIVVASTLYKDYSPAPTSSLSVWLLKVHGVLMLTAWMLCCTTAVILARFYKKQWLETKLCGEKMWFAWHRALAIGCTSLTIIGIILAFVAVGGWSAVQGLPLDAHAYLGVTVTALAVANPIMGFFRCNPGTENRKIFNLVHWLVGNIALVLAGTTMLIGLQMRADVCPVALQNVAAAYVAWFLASYLGLLLEERLRARLLTETESAGQEKSVAMQSLKDDGDHTGTPATTSGCSQDLLRRVFFVIHLVITMSVTAAIIITIFASA